MNNETVWSKDCMNVVQNANRFRIIYITALTTFQIYTEFFIKESLIYHFYSLKNAMNQLPILIFRCSL